MGYDDIDFELDVNGNLDLRDVPTQAPHPEDALLQSLAAAMGRAGLSAAERAALREAVTDAFELLGDVEIDWPTLPALSWSRHELAAACDRRDLPSARREALARFFFEFLAASGRIASGLPAPGEPVAHSLARAA
ncbi:MAG: hypothetical protein PVI30_10480 [Myxococcales bacterium]|jgi:hypothetical protein